MPEPDVLQLVEAGRALHDDGRLDEAREVFEKILVIDPGNTIARNRVSRIIHAQRRQAAALKPRPGVKLRDPAEALAILDGPWRQDCVRFLAETLLFARHADSTRTIVRDVPNENYFYVAGGAPASVGPWVGLMDTYVDGRGMPEWVIERVVAEGGQHRHWTRQGVVPYSIRLQIPFELIGELREVLRDPMQEHIRNAIAAGPPQHQHLDNPRLAAAIIAEGAR